MAVLELKGIEKRFGSVFVLRGIDLSLDSNQTVAIVGPNGCGKSTLLRIVSGLEKPNAGELLLDGKSLLGLVPHQRPISFIPQLGGYYEHLTVHQNLKASLTAYRLSGAEAEYRIDWISELLGLKPLYHAKISELSGGQIQKVALGRGLIRKPQILLMDEPLNHLDRASQQNLHSQVQSIQQEMGLSILYVTHRSEESLSIADRIALLLEGRIQQVDSPIEIFDRPNSLQIAKMFGEPPIISARAMLATDLSSRYVELWNRRIALTESQVSYLDTLTSLSVTSERSSREVKLGIRPHAFTIRMLGEEASLQDEVYWKAQIVDRRFLGEGWLVEIAIGTEPVISLALNRQLGDASKAGDIVLLTLEPKSICFFAD